MTKDKMKMVLACLAMAGVFALCGVGVAQHTMDVKAAIAIALASVSSVGAIFGYTSKD